MSYPERAPKRIPYDGRLFFTVSGKGRIMVEEIVYEMPEGAMLYFNAGTKYMIMSPDPKEKVSYVLLNLDLSEMEKHRSDIIPPAYYTGFDESAMIATPNFEQYNFAPVMYAQGLQRLKYQFENIVNEYSRRLLYHDEMNSHRCAEVMLELLRASSVSKGATVGNKADQIIGFIHKNYAHPLTNKVIGDKFSYHPNYVSSLIKSITGLPLHKYLLKVRLSKALDLIYLGERSVSKIAELTGFCDINYFSKYFKQEIGISPKNYMKE